MRDHLTDIQKEAARLLDFVRAGGNLAPGRVTWCLWILGDITNEPEVMCHA